MTDHFSTPRKSGKIRVAIVLTIVAILVASAAAATRLYMAYRLPDPETADIDGMFRWLVLADLADHPTEVRQILARRLEEAIDEEIDWDEIHRRLTPEYRERLWSNIEILLQPWFFDKMDRYAAAGPTEKNELLDQFLDQSDLWRHVAGLAPAGKFDKTPPGTGVTMFLLGKIRSWKETASPKEAQRMDEFINALQIRWLLRRFSNST